MHVGFSPSACPYHIQETQSKEGASGGTEMSSMNEALSEMDPKRWGILRPARWLQPDDLSLIAKD